MLGVTVEETVFRFRSLGVGISVHVDATNTD